MQIFNSKVSSFKYEQYTAVVYPKKCAPLSVCFNCVTYWNANIPPKMCAALSVRELGWIKLLNNTLFSAKYFTKCELISRSCWTGIQSLPMELDIRKSMISSLTPFNAIEISFTWPKSVPLFVWAPLGTFYDMISPKNLLQSVVHSAYFMTNINQKVCCFKCELIVHPTFRQVA